MVSFSASGSKEKDSALHIKETKEFVVNIISEPSVIDVWQQSCDLLKAYQLHANVPVCIQYQVYWSGQLYFHWLPQGSLGVGTLRIDPRAFNQGQTGSLPRSGRQHGVRRWWVLHYNLNFFSYDFWWSLSSCLRTHTWGEWFSLFCSSVTSWSMGFGLGCLENWHWTLVLVVLISHFLVSISRLDVRPIRPEKTDPDCHSRPDQGEVERMQPFPGRGASD